VRVATDNLGYASIILLYIYRKVYNRRRLYRTLYNIVYVSIRVPDASGLLVTTGNRVLQDPPDEGCRAG